uniref:Uncharacterized protein n=1 Tax=Rhizophora mucronata TaxID=61149 RepID=A0A2P2NHG2_RHIMU
MEYKTGIASNNEGGLGTRPGAHKTKSSSM